jgi:hypothetical protein
LDIRLRILFIPSGIKKDELYNRSFLELSFATKSLDAINLVDNILHKILKIIIVYCILSSTL